MPKIRNFTVVPALPSPIKDLDIIAGNMFWTWNAEYVELFKRIDSNLWSTCGHNPVKLLGAVSQEQLNSLSKDQGFVSELKRLAEKLNTYLEKPAWFDSVQPKDNKALVAYFCAEFGIHESLPIYAGGLGILAGDHLKSASDLGIPMVAVGLLYQKGYFRQYLNIDGWQQEVYIENDFYNMPIELVKNPNGQPLTISVDYPGRSVIAQIWCANIGRVKLYLLDTNIEANSSGDRMITSCLYGGDRELRIRQEVLLGIGGIKTIAALGLSPTAYHINEGHAAFMTLERIRQIQTARGMSFNEALEATRTNNVFTTHTLVKAGLDEFRTELMDKYFGSYYPCLGISREQFLSLGRIFPDDDSEPFKMPILAIKLSSYRNGVSKLHGQVSRGMWSNLWAGVPVNEVPIDAITNGIHTKNWLAAEINSLYEKHIGPNWSDEFTDKSIWQNIDNIPDEELWHTHHSCKEKLIAYIRNRMKHQMQQRGTCHTESNLADEILDPEALTIGFARRFTGYKRGNLLLKDPNRLLKILNDPARPLQLIFAGKAHPGDIEGKEIIREIIHFTNQYNVKRKIIFLEDYDIDMARMLVSGADIWLNNPRRPLEASGTSGMKAAANGVINMSILDGWWCEGYKPHGGWSIGVGETYDDCDYQDLVESQAIYNLLENEIIPLFYNRSADTLPRAWIQRMKNSIKWIVPQFNTHRMVGEYTQRLYNPAMARWKHLTDGNGDRIRTLAEWKANIESAWGELEIKDVEVLLANGENIPVLGHERIQLKVGSKLKVRTLVSLDGLTPDNVSVELYHGSVDSWGNIKEGSAIAMNCDGPAEETDYWFTTVMSCTTAGQQGITVRILPKHPDLVNPYEMGLILWESATAKTGVTAG